MITAVSKGWTIKSVDVASAFLQGREIDRDVYIKPPAELCEKDKVWKLKRCLYGLNDAPREWYNALYDEFIALGAVRSTLDNAMFMRYKGDEIFVHMLMTSTMQALMIGKFRSLKPSRPNSSSAAKMRDHTCIWD
jgi:hypothetical protein